VSLDWVGGLLMIHLVGFGRRKDKMFYACTVFAMIWNIWFQNFKNSPFNATFVSFAGFLTAFCFTIS
jgi:hypothetical protein